MRVKVTRKAFWNGRLQYEGTILEWPDKEKLPSWAVKVSATTPPKQAESAVKFTTEPKVEPGDIEPGQATTEPPDDGAI